MFSSIRAIAFIILALTAASQGAFAIQPKNMSSLSVSSISGVSSDAGTITSIDSKKGVVILDNARQYSFSPKTILVRDQNNQSRVVTLPAITQGQKVSLTLIKSATTGKMIVSELWIAK